MGGGGWRTRLWLGCRDRLLGAQVPRWPLVAGPEGSPSASVNVVHSGRGQGLCGPAGWAWACGLPASTAQRPVLLRLRPGARGRWVR